MRKNKDRLTPPGENDVSTQNQKSGDTVSDDVWLKRSTDAFNASVNFANTNWRNQWTNNLRMFQNKHPLGSKYNTEAYKYRSKLFRPKIRSATRNTEAAGAAAFFSSMDVVAINPVGLGKEQKAASKLIKEAVDYRLQSPQMRWFLTVMGGLQDAMKMGVVASYNYWKKDDRNPNKVIDHPCVELTPIDQIHFHPGASWIDPIGTSPYVIRQIPMFIQDVKEDPRFAKCTDGEFAASLIGFDSINNVRNNNQEDPQQMQVPGGEKMTDFSMVWVHQVFMRINGKDYVYYTLHTNKRLTDPEPIENEFWHGERPITLGFYVLESHRAMPPGVPELGEQIQREANEIVNSRQDNVKLALNKRYIIKRGANVDIRSLLRNASGSATMADNPDSDVRELEWNDVTSSAYEEQSRLDVDFDGIVGGFNAGTVQTNRHLNETVGGLSMLQSAAGQLQDYGLKTFSETWLEPTLRQVTKLVQYYESDETILAVCADRAEIWNEIAQITDELMMQDLLITVDVGVGNSNPGFRLERFVSGIRSFTEIAQNLPPEMDAGEIAAEMFSYLGYKDGRRFFKDMQNPEIAKAMAQIQMLTEELQKAQEGDQLKVAIQQVKDEAAMARQEDQHVFELVLELLKQYGSDNQVDSPEGEQAASEAASNYRYAS